MTFGERLREARLKKGLTQAELAEMIGVAKSTFTGYEKGNREPDVFKIKRILEILEMDSDYLLDIKREEKQIMSTLSEDEIELVSDFRRLNDEGQKHLKGTISDMIAGGRYEPDEYLKEGVA